ncbi:MAG: ABC transporter substrate-binding protein, partial [Halobacteriaceae archaeon]
AIIDQFVEGLYRLDDHFQFVPILADGQPTVENAGQQYYVSIDDRAVFPTGEPVTARDVVYSYRAPVREGASTDWRVSMIDSIVEIDANTVRFDLKYPYAPFIATLCWPVVSRSAREEGLDSAIGEERYEQTSSFVGTGPFQVAETNPDGTVKVMRWNEYWRDIPIPLSEVVFTPVPDDTARVVQLRTDEQGLIEKIPPAAWTALEELQRVDRMDSAGYNYHFLGINTRSGPGKYSNVREALDSAIDLDAAVAEFIEPAGTREYMPVPEPIARTWDFPIDRWEDIPLRQDISRARELLQGADVAPEYEFTIVAPPDDARERICEALAQGIRDAGWNASVNRHDWPRFLETVRSGDNERYDVYCGGWNGGLDPDTYLYPLFGPDAAGETDGTFYKGVVDPVTRG